MSIEVRKLSSKPFVITTWYRPPNSSVDLFPHFDTVLRKLDSENVEHYLMGDLNSDLLSENNTYANALLNVSDVYGLRRLITEPTRITPSSCSLLDLIFTNRPDCVCLSVVSHVSISDHSLVYAFQKISIPAVSKGYYRLFLRILTAHEIHMPRHTSSARAIFRWVIFSIDFLRFAKK